MAFEIFKETGARTKEFISVTEKQAFGMSRAFLDHYKITTEHKAIILYDPDTNSVGLYFSLNEPKHGFSVRIPNEKHGAAIVAKSFFEVKGIDAKRYAGRYNDFKRVPLSDLGFEAPGNAYVFTLKEAPAAEEPKQEEPTPVVVDLRDIPF